jgi:hypothetical protein
MSFAERLAVYLDHIEGSSIESLLQEYVTDTTNEKDCNVSASIAEKCFFLLNKHAD